MYKKMPWLTLCHDCHWRFAKDRPKERSFYEATGNRTKQFWVCDTCDQRRREHFAFVMWRVYGRAVDQLLLDGKIDMQGNLLI